MMLRWIDNYKILQFCDKWGFVINIAQPLGWTCKQVHALLKSGKHLKLLEMWDLIVSVPDYCLSFYFYWEMYNNDI